MKLTNQLTLLKSIKTLINKLDDFKYNLSSKDKEYSLEVYNEFTNYLSNNILSKLSDEIINFDLDILNDMFNINVNKDLLKGKNLYFLYEYICYNLFTNIDDYDNYINLLFLGCFNLHQFSNVIYLNKFHYYDDGSYDNIINYIGNLNLIKDNEENIPKYFYIYTLDDIIDKCNIEHIFNITNTVNIIHLHNYIYINDKLFLDYIDIPNNIIIQYPKNCNIFDEYFNDYNVLKGDFEDSKLIFINDNYFNINEFYSIKYNFIIYDNITNNNDNINDANNIFMSIFIDILSLYKRCKNEKLYTEFPIDEFKDINSNSKFYNNVINYFYPNINRINNINEINNIKRVINNYITKMYNNLIIAIKKYE